MKSQELMHLHALLFQVRIYLEREGTVSPDDFERYDDQPVRPSHIHRGKRAHERAIGLLLADINRSTQRTASPDSTLLL